MREHQFSGGIHTPGSETKYQSTLQDLHNLEIEQDGSLRTRRGLLNHIAVIKEFQKAQIYAPTSSTLSIELMIFLDRSLKILPKEGESFSEISNTPWRNPNQCEIHEFRGHIVILHPQMPPKILTRAGRNYALSNFFQAQNQYGERLQPFVSPSPERLDIVGRPVPADHRCSDEIGEVVRIGGETQRIVLTSNKGYLKNVAEGDHIRIFNLELRVIERCTNNKHIVQTLRKGEDVSVFRNLFRVDSLQVQAFTDKNGYPSKGCVYHNRFILGGSRNFPGTFWFSDLGHVSRFSPDGREDQARTITFSEISFPIRKIIDLGTLFILTAGEIFSLAGDGIDAIGLQRHQDIDINASLPVRTKDGLVIGSGRALYKLRYSRFTGALELTNITQSLSHIDFSENTMFLDPGRNDLVVSMGKDVYVYHQRDRTSGWSRHTFQGKEVLGGAYYNRKRLLLIDWDKEKKEKRTMFWESDLPLDNSFEFSSAVVAAQYLSEGFASEGSAMVDQLMDTHLYDVLLKHENALLYAGRFRVFEFQKKGELEKLVGKIYFGQGFRQNLASQIVPLGKGAGQGRIAPRTQLTLRFRDSYYVNIETHGAPAVKALLGRWRSRPGFYYLAPASSDHTVHLHGLETVSGYEAAWRLNLSTPLPLHLTGLLINL